MDITKHKSFSNRPKSDSYDIVIIGAGIGGLVCGCYLSKKGYKVLVIEQHSKPGGYCSSFSRKGYKFDIGIHYLGGVTTGILSKIFEELDIKDELNLVQSDPSDKIIMPDSTTYIRANPNNTIKEFQASFPDEKESIQAFFNFIMHSDVLTIYSKVKNITMSKVLDQFFVNEKLKATISILFLTNMGLPHTKVAAFAAIIFLREFILDPGYVPRNGIHQLTDCLVNKFKKHNGELVLSCKANKIIVESNIARGIILDSGEMIMAKSIVSNIDATQTFKHLINIKTKEASVLDNLVASNSIFGMYLGIKTPISSFFSERCNIWFFSTYDIDNCFTELRNNLQNKNITGMLISFPSSKNNFEPINDRTIQILTNAPFENNAYWNELRQPLSQTMLSIAEIAIPGLKENIDIMVTATPHSFFRYTSNKNGAAYGWASMANQVDSSLLPQKTSIINLFLAGHWCTMGAGQGGISTVALSGKKASETIIKTLKQN